MTLTADFARGLRIVSRPSVVGWAESSIDLSPRVSRNLPGRYSTHYCPQIRDILECYRDPDVRDITWVAGAQSFKTLTALVGHLYLVDNDPGTILIGQPTEVMGRSFSRERLHPIIEENAALSRHLPDDSDEFKLLEMSLRPCTIVVAGTQSVNNLISRPVPYVWIDEAQRAAQANERGPSAIAEAWQRTKQFPHTCKRTLTGTPTTTENEFWQRYLLGTRENFLVPCPHCRAGLVFEHKKETLVWDESAKDQDGRWNLRKVRESARYICPSCSAEIRDHHKPAMLTGGGWESTNADHAESGHRSFHLSSFYSPTVTFGAMACEFLRSIDLFGFDDYHTNWLALPWEPQSAIVKDDQLLALRHPSHRLGTIPFDPVLVTIGADFGQLAQHWSVYAFDVDGNQWLVDYGTVLAPEDILPILAREWPIVDKPGGAPTGRAARIQCGLADSGDFTERIYRLCAASGGILHPSKGSSATFGTWSQGALRDFPGLMLYTYVDFTAKWSLYIESIARALAPRLIWPADTGQDFIAGHAGQKVLEYKSPRGRITREFKKVAADHYGDTTKVQRVAWWILRAT